MKKNQAIPFAKLEIPYPNNQFQMAIKIIGEFLKKKEMECKSIQIQKFLPSLSPVLEINVQRPSSGSSLFLKAVMNLGSRNEEISVTYSLASMQLKLWGFKYFVFYKGIEHDLEKYSFDALEESKTKGVEDDFLKLRKFNYPFRFNNEKIEFLCESEEKYIRADVERQLLNAIRCTHFIEPKANPHTATQIFAIRAT